MASRSLLVILVSRVRLSSDAHQFGDDGNAPTACLMR
jgi:hypothetical protein